MSSQSQQADPFFDVDADLAAVRDVVDAFLDAFRSGPDSRLGEVLDRDLHLAPDS